MFNPTSFCKTHLEFGNTYYFLPSCYNTMHTVKFRLLKYVLYIMLFFQALTRLGAYLCMPNLVVTQDYCDKFVEADGMFMYQPVFDPKSRRMVTLNPLPPGEKSVLVDLLPPDTAYQLALGNLNPFNLKPLDSWDPDQPQVSAYLLSML